MRSAFRGVIVAFAGLVCLASSAAAQTAQPPPKPWPEPSANPRDFSGVYFPSPPGYYRLRPIDGSEVPFLPATRAEFARHAAGEAANAPLVNTSTLCLPSGTPRVMTAPYPVKIIVQPKEVTMLFEVQHLMRFIYMNEEHPKDLDPTFMGHSVGHWEGDTLVVDVTGFNDKTWLSGTGTFHSEDLHITERYTRVDKDQINYEVTMEDPKVLTKPWTLHSTIMLREGTRLQEYVCAENNLDPGNFEKLLKGGANIPRQ